MPCLHSADCVLRSVDFAEIEGGPQRVDAVSPRRVDVCVGREAAVEFKDGHAVRECPCGPGEIEVLARGLVERQGGALFAPELPGYATPGARTTRARASSRSREASWQVQAA